MSDVLECPRVGDVLRAFIRAVLVELGMREFLNIASRRITRLQDRIPPEPHARATS